MFIKTGFDSAKYNYCMEMNRSNPGRSLQIYWMSSNFQAKASHEDI